MAVTMNYMTSECLPARKQGEEAEHKPECLIPPLPLPLPHRKYVYLHERAWLVGPQVTYFLLYTFLKLEIFYISTCYLSFKNF